MHRIACVILSLFITSGINAFDVKDEYLPTDTLETATTINETPITAVLSTPDTLEDASLPTPPDTVRRRKPLSKILNPIMRAADAVTDFFMGCDTNYVTPQKYEFTAQAELSYFHDYYRMTSSESGKSKNMVLQSGNPLVLGAYVYWSIFGYGRSINLEDIGHSRPNSQGTGYRNSLVLNTARIVAEIYNFKLGKNAKFTNISDIDLTGQDRNFVGLKSRCEGIDAQYIFNHRRYSWPAAFGENAVQRRSQGSWKLGFSYSHVSIDFDASLLSPYIYQQIDSTLLFNHVSYHDYAVSVGYGYNWAFRRNCILAVSILPSIGYRRSDITNDSHSRDILRRVSTDIFFRTSLFWNNTKYFTGLVVDVHTYAYRQDKFSLTNSYGTVKFIAGFNFLKKGEYK